MKLDFLNNILLEERTGAQPHPEDSIFDGAAAAQQALSSLLDVIKNPGSITIKWDGFPALIFGRLPDGRFTVQDKYMFDNQVFATSIEDWQRYDSQKRSAKLRPDLYQKLNNIWPGLEEAVGSSPGFFWGDLLWSQPLKAVSGKFVFKPNVVEYRIPVKSTLGQQIAGKVGGVVVHQYFADSRSRPQPWNGQGLNITGSVAILTPSAGVKFRLDEPVQLTKAASTAINQYGRLAESFLGGLDKVARAAIQTYTNKKITGQTNEELVDWLRTNISGKQYKLLVGENYGGYLYRNEKGLNALFNVWNALYALKTNLAQQLEQQVQGIEQWVGGRQEGEGFVFNTPHGLVKLVQRGTFSRALFNK